MAEKRCNTSDFKPKSLGPRAEALWAELHSVGDSVERAILIGEACRLVDRLDTLGKILSGEAETWMRLIARTERAEYDLKIDAAEAAARGSATALRQILSQLSSQQAASPPGGTLADEIAARRTARQSNSAG